MRFTWRKQYDDDLDEFERLATDVQCNDPSLTQQQFATDADINVLVRRFGITDGAVPPVAVDPRFFADFSDAVDFREALDRSRVALDRFEALPADLRSRFGNDPVSLYSFVTDPENLEEAVRLGLLQKAAPAVTEAPPAPSPADPSIA